MTRPAQRHAPKAVSQAHNDQAAMMKVTIAPLPTLTDAMVESIARSHCSKREGGYAAMLEKLRGMVAARRRCEV